MSSRRGRIVSGIVWLAVLYLAVQVVFPFYIGRLITGRVIDGVTGEPIEGAVVVASWDMESVLTGTSARSLALQETTTSEAGEFSIPGWGPRFSFDPFRRPFSGPIVLIYKRGYISERVSNRSKPSAPSWAELGWILSPVIRAKFSGDEIALYTLESAEHLKNLSDLDLLLAFASEMRWLGYGGGPLCEQIPNTIRVFKEDLRRQANDTTELGLAEKERIGSAMRIGSSCDAMTEDPL